MDMFVGFFFGISFGLIISLFILVPVSPKWSDTPNVLVEKGKNSLICRKNETYPKMNCKLIVEALGPRKNTFTVKVEK